MSSRVGAAAAARQGIHSSHHNGCRHRTHLTLTWPGYAAVFSQSPGMDRRVFVRFNLCRMIHRQGMCDASSVGDPRTFTHPALSGSCHGIPATVADSGSFRRPGAIVVGEGVQRRSPDIPVKGNEREDGAGMV